MYFRLSCLCALSLAACAPALTGSESGTEGQAGRVLPGALILNEVMFHPNHCVEGDRTSQWFEIHNLTDEAVELGDLLLLNSRFETAEISPYTLEPHGYALVGRGDAERFCTNGVDAQAYFDGSMQLELTGEALALVDAESREIIDGIPSFGPDDVAEGFSVSARSSAETASDNDFIEDWTSMERCTETLNATPAAANLCTPNPVIDEDWFGLTCEIRTIGSEAEEDLRQVEFCPIPTDFDPASQIEFAREMAWNANPEWPEYLFQFQGVEGLPRGAGDEAPNYWYYFTIDDTNDLLYIAVNVRDMVIYSEYDQPQLPGATLLDQSQEWDQLGGFSVQEAMDGLPEGFPISNVRLWWPEGGVPTLSIFGDGESYRWNASSGEAL